MSEAIPKALGRYEIQEEIGRGMMGVVYSALDPALGRTVALKTVRLAFSIPEAEREMFEKRFLNEARAAAGLSHAGIVVVHDVGRDPETGTLFIALEFLHGRTLAQLTEDGRPMDWREALRLTARIAEALHQAHAQGVVHRDIKPANVMVLPSGEPKIMDFGIAKVPASQLTTAGEFFGTPSYMSPEQTAGETLDGRSDLFSLGTMLYLMLTGRRAFDGPSVPVILHRVSTQDPPPPSSLAPSLPPEADYLVARALAKRPGDRYPDGKTLAEDIEDILAGRPPRHRAAWKEPERFEGTWVSVEPLTQPETEDLSPRPRTPPPRPATGPARAAATAPAGGEGSFVMRVADRMGARGLAALAALVAAGLVVALLMPRGQRPAQPATGPSPTPSPAQARSETQAPPEPTPSSLLGLFHKEPAHLDVSFEHSLKSGTLKLWVDDDLVLEEKLTSRVVKKLGIVKSRKGSMKKVLDVSPGEHVIKVQVQGDGFFGSNQIKGSFESGKTRRLEANRQGLPLLKKELALDWS